jgi:hypothetical protein
MSISSGIGNRQRAGKARAYLSHGVGAMRNAMMKG